MFFKGILYFRYQQTSILSLSDLVWVSTRYMVLQVFFSFRFMRAVRARKLRLFPALQSAMFLHIEPPVEDLSTIFTSEGALFWVSVACLSSCGPRSTRRHCLSSTTGLGSAYKNRKLKYFFLFFWIAHAAKVGGSTFRRQTKRSKVKSKSRIFTLTLTLYPDESHRWKIQPLKLRKQKLKGREHQ